MEKASKAYLKNLRQFVRDKEARNKAGLFVAEGKKIVLDMLNKNKDIDSLLISSSFMENDENKAFLDDVGMAAFSVFSAKNSDFETISSLQNSQGILALFKMPKTIEEIPILNKKDFLILCDNIQDPGNLGAIIRTAVAFNSAGVILSPDTVSVYNPKVVRASSGTILDLPIYSMPNDVDVLKQKGFKILVGVVPEENVKKIDEIEKTSGPYVLAFGSEGKGLSEYIKTSADEYFYVPISENIESLNVTQAAAIAMYEFSRDVSKNNPRP